MAKKRKSKKWVIIIAIILFIMLVFSNLYCTFHKITSKEIEMIRPVLLPGDVVLERNEWRITNLLYPGFWKHTFIYAGTLSEMDEYFKGSELLNSSVSEYIKENMPDTYQEYLKKVNGYNSSMIEAKHLVVRVGPIEDYAQSEYLAVLRPMVSKDTKLRAVLKALSFAGRPYDITFNYYDNSSLACSEVVYHSYKADNNEGGLDFKLAKVLWVDALLPNDMAKCFALKNDSGSCGLEFVAFLDPDNGFENTANVSAFSGSWKRFTITILRGSAFD